MHVNDARESYSILISKYVIREMRGIIEVQVCSRCGQKLCNHSQHIGITFGGVIKSGSINEDDFTSIQIKWNGSLHNACTRLQSPADPQV